MLRFFALLLIGFSAAFSASAEPITVFAAASLRGALDEVNASFQTTKVTTSYASSAALARQIQLGAPADVFISANPQWMAALQAQNPESVAYQADILGNQLVLIGAESAPRITLDDLPKHLGTQRIAMGFTKAVPAGIYGRRALEHLGLWTEIEPHVVQTDNVRAALALVALQEATFGIVYLTDALAEPKVHILADIPLSASGPIRYPAAALNDRAISQAYMEHLQSRSAQQIFARHGFVTDDPS